MAIFKSPAKESPEAVPKSETPPYFTMVLQWSYRLLIAYFVCFMVFTLCFGFIENFLAAMPWGLAACAALFFSRRSAGKKDLFFYTVILLGWLVVFVYTYGWDCGGQHFLMPLMVIMFFSIYDSFPRKLIFMGVLFCLRLYLFYYSLQNEPLYLLGITPSSVLQIINTVYIFINMAVVCLIFSTNIQKAEKQLLIYNQELQQQACTDPLTTLHNRRYMLDILQNRVETNPNEIFSVALGDIDLFKKINDSLGHNCGDQVLKNLAALFKNMVLEKGYVCRWGGEEFFFFLPDMNLDEASVFINDLNIAVSRLPIIYKEQKLRVTMTFGVEEYDYQSTLTELIKRADDKLYQGKKTGRNRVVF